MFVIPEEVKILIIFLVVQGLKAISNVFGFDFEGRVSVLVAVIVGSIIYFLNGILGLVPEQYVEIVRVSLQLIGMLLSAFGIHYVYKNNGIVKKVINNPYVQKIVE